MTVEPITSGCILCDAALLDPADLICNDCVARVVMFVSTASELELVGLWPILDAARPTDPSNEEDIAEAIVQGAAELNVNAQGHADLAAAFLEMGLLADATSEGVTALRASAEIGGASKAALKVLLDERIGGKQIVDDFQRVLKGRGWG